MKANSKIPAWKISRPFPARPRLRFSPTAWGKLLYLRDLGETEIGGFGLAETEDPLLVTDIALVDQVCTPVSVKFIDEAVADFFDQQVDRGLRPAQFARIWLHTHPGDCPEPSITDEETFARVFGHADWSVMFILARGGQKYARLQFSAGPGGAVKIPVRIEFSVPFAASDSVAWEADYFTKVTARSENWVTIPDAKTEEPWIAQDGSPTDIWSASEADLSDPFYYREECWYD